MKTPWKLTTYLGEGKETFGNGRDVLHLADVVDTLLDGVGVLGASTVKDTLNAVDVSFRPLRVRLSDNLSDAGCWFVRVTIVAMSYAPCQCR